MKSGNLAHVAGIAVLSFGFGILLSFFLPDGVLVVIEALIIIMFGGLCLLAKK